ncbi:N-acetylmuramoyl-L-alanine amidase [Actinophytocola sp. NPDC049390]|uniref:N-acetylmuramoyl-L-alanine amidase n=1 Tax=Actinophytocola sp. NPDC049390 TaxID=3363894 RepID=UPI00379B70BE
MRRRLAALGTALTVAVGLMSTPAAAAAPGSVNAAFARAAHEFDVPRDLVVAVGYGETHLDGHGGEPSQDNGYGVMHLVSNPSRQTLELAAELTGESTDVLKKDTAANIRGGAAVLRSLADEAGMSGEQRDRIAAWYPVVARYGGATDDAVARLYADTVYELLASGMQVRTPGGEPVVVRPYPSAPERGRFEKVASGGVSAQGLDYPNSRWIAAHPNNYSPGRSSAINLIVVHVTQGSYAGTISWFQNPSSGVSTHYVVRSSDGEITQMVRDGDTAYHVRNANSRALGIEHEGFVDNPSWFTDSMYRSSAALTKWLCERHGLPKTRQYVQGHNQIPGNDHTDPGPHWNWDYYMSLVNSGGSAAVHTGSSTDFNGDGRDDIIAFNQGNLGDVYVATSNGSGFAGTSVKWHDWFAPGGETPLTGDFNGDGKDDIVTFTHGSLNDVYVALSTGSSFGGGAKWHDWFALGGEVPAVGDVNGDGKDDIVTFTRNNLADVYVALSTGTSFTASAKWHDYFGLAGEIPGVGDFNGDGKDDIVVFNQGTQADVYVATSTGTGFSGTSVKWHDFFSIAGEAPRIGDFNGDGRDDIATFTLNAAADVYVATSTGSGFSGTTVKWNDFFGLAGEFPYTGDATGDGKDDVLTFTKGTLNDVYVGASTGTAFAGGAKWHDFFGLNGEVTL